MPLSDDSSGAEIPTLGSLDSVNIDVDETGLNNYLDGLIGQGINPSTVDINSDDFKSFFSVTTEGVEGILEFYLYTNEPLRTGENTIEVRVFTMGNYTDHYETGEDFVPDQDLITLNSEKTVNIRTQMVQASVTSIEITEHPDNVWSSTSEEEFKDQLTVVAHYSDGTSHEIRNYCIEWDYRESEVQSVTISYGDSDTITTSFPCTSVQPLPVTISDGDVTVRDGYTVRSGDSSTEIVGKLRVVATSEDGKKHVLDSTDYNVSDNLYTGADSSTLTPVPVEITISITTPDGSESFPVTIYVTPSTPLSVAATIIPGTEFTAYTQTPLSSFDVRVFFQNSLYQKQVTEGYTIRYVNDDGTIRYGEEENILAAGSYTLYIDYTEAGSTIQYEVGEITVGKIQIPYPGLSSGRLTYTTTSQSWNVTSFTEGVVDAVVELWIDDVKQDDNGGASLVVENGTATIQATLEGEYRITFVIDDAERVQESYEFSSAATTYSRYIDPGIPVITLADDWNSWTYGHFTEPTFQANLVNTQTQTSVPITEGDIDWDLVVVEYFSDSALSNKIEDPEALQVGTYYIRVTVPREACTNLQPTDSGPLQFAVTVNTLTPSITGSYEYTGSEQHPDITVTDAFGDGVDSDGVFSCDATAEDAGTYSVSATLLDTRNYRWADDSNVLQWTISPKEIGYPTVSIGNTMYNGTNQTWTVSNTDGTTFDSENFLVSISCSVDGDVVPAGDMMFSYGNAPANTLTAMNAGTYTVVFRINANSNGGDNRNYVWTDDSQEGITIVIDRASLTLIGTTGVEIVYGQNAPEFSIGNLVITGWQGDDGNIPSSFVTIGSFSTGYTAGNRPGDYTLSIEDIESRNYSFADSSATFTVGKADLIIDGMEDMTVKYGSPKPDESDYTYSVSDSTPLFESSINYALDNGIISFEVQNGYTSVSPALDSNGDVIAYSFYIDNETVSSDYYKITLQGANGILTVERLGVHISWTESSFQYSETSGSAPTFQILVEGSTAENPVVLNQTNYLATWWNGDVSDNNQVDSSFTEGGYTLELTLTDSSACRYYWDDEVSVNIEVKDGSVYTDSIVDIPFEITYDRVTLTLDLDETLEYGFALDDFKTNHLTADRFSSIEGDPTLQNEVEALIQSGTYTVQFILSGTQPVTDPLNLESGSTYAVRVIFGNVGTNYVMAETSDGNGITVTDRQATVNVIEFDETPRTYDNTDKGYTFENLSQYLQNVVRGSADSPITPSWTFSIQSDSGISLSFTSDQNGDVEIVLHEAGIYTVTYTVTADNHTFTYTGDNEFTITINPATPILTFTGAQTPGLNASYAHSYGDPDFSEPTASAFEGDDDETFSWTFTLGQSDYSWNDLMDEIRNADTYSVTYTVTSSNDIGSINYRATGTLTFYVSDASMKITVMVDGEPVTDTSWNDTYDGETHAVTFTAFRGDTQLMDVTWSYSNSNGGTTSIVSDSLTLNFTDVSDSCTVTYGASKTNHIAVSDQQFTVTIDQKGVQGILGFNYDSDGDGEADSFQYTYGDTKGMSGSIDGFVDGDSDGWTWTFTVNGSSGTGFDWLNSYFGEDVNANTYSVTFSLSHNSGNYEQTGSTTFDVTILKRTLTIDLPNNGTDFVTYGDELNRDSFVDHIYGLAYGRNFEDEFSGQSLVINYSQGDDATDNGGGPYYVDGRSLTSVNYDVSQLYDEFTVAKLEVTIVFDTVLTPQYGTDSIDLYDSVRITSDGLYPTDAAESSVFNLGLYKNSDGTGTNVSTDDALWTVDNYYIIPTATGNYTLSYDTPGQLQVGKRVIDVGYSPNSFTFDGQPLSNTEILGMFTFDLPDFITESQFIAMIELSFRAHDANDDPEEGNPVNAGTYDVGITVNSDTYDVSLPSGMTITINPASYGATVFFPTDRNLVYTGNPYEFPLWVRGSSDSTGTPITGENWNIVMVAPYGGDPLTVTYYVDGKLCVDGSGNPTYPQLTDVKDDGSAYVITVSFKGDDNYNISYYENEANNLSISVLINPAINDWTNSNATGGTGWMAGYQYTDFDYSESDNGTPIYSVNSLFGEVETRFYEGSVSENNYLGDDWRPSDTTVPGTYYVVVSVDDNKNYTNPETVQYSFTVSKMRLSVTLDPATTTFVQGETSTTTLYGYDPSLMEFLLQQGDVTIQHVSDEGDDRGILSTEEPGIYIFTLQLVNPDCYEWADSDIADLLSMRWTVTDETVANRWTQIPSIGNWTYGDEPSTPSAEALYGSGVEFSYLDEDRNPLQGRPTDAGNYILVAHVDAGTDSETGPYSELTSEVRFTIHPYRVSTPSMASVSYTGEQVTVPYTDETATIYGSTVTLYTVSGQSATDIGDYTATLTLNGSGNFVWQDGTTGEREVMWRIVSGEIPTYSDFAVDTSPETYTGSPITKNVICHRDEWTEGNDYSVSYSDNTNVGEVTITVSGTASDGTPWSLTFAFDIVKATPVLDFVNDGFQRYENDGTFVLNPYLSGEADLSDLVWTSSDESVATVDEDGLVTLRGLGTATIRAELPESDNWFGVYDTYTLTVGETQTEIVVVPGPGSGSGGGYGDGEVIYIPTVITHQVDGGISDTVWLIILACTVIVLLAVMWVLWNRRVGA